MKRIRSENICDEKMKSIDLASLFGRKHQRSHRFEDCQFKEKHHCFKAMGDNVKD